MIDKLGQQVSGSPPGEPALLPFDGGARTMQLSIKLRDGFRNNDVGIRVDGKQVYHKQGVTTDLTISFADAVSVPVATQKVQVEIAVSGHGSQSRLIDVPATPFVDVHMVDGKMELRASPEEIPML